MEDFGFLVIEVLAWIGRLILEKLHKLVEDDSD